MSSSSDESVPVAPAEGIDLRPEATGVQQVPKESAILKDQLVVPSNAQEPNQSLSVSAQKSNKIQQGHSKPLRTSTMSTINMLQNIVKEGYLNRKTEHYHLLGSNSTTIGKTWKVYKVVLRGTKLYFFKPPTDHGLKNWFPTIKAGGADVEQQRAKTGKDQPVTGSDAIPSNFAFDVNAFTASLSSGVASKADEAYSNRQVTEKASSNKGLELVPSMFDASTKLLLFSDTVIPSLTSQGSASTPKSSLSPKAQGSETTNLISKYDYGDVFFELDVMNMRFKQQLVLLIFEDNVMVLTKKWVRITRSTEQQGDNRRSMDLHDGSESAGSRIKTMLLGGTGGGQGTSSAGQEFKKIPIDNSVNLTAGKTMTKLTFDVTYPLHAVQVYPTVTVVPVDAAIHPHGNKGAPETIHRTEETIYCFEFVLPDQQRRFFRARNQQARDLWIRKFEAAKEEHHLRLGIPLEKRINSDTPISPEEIARMWGSEFDSKTSTEKLNDSARPVSFLPQAPKRQRKFWGIGRHPEIYVAQDGSVEVLQGGTSEGLIHEFLFRNVSSSSSALSYENLKKVLITLSGGPICGRSTLDELYRLYQLSAEKPENVYTPVVARILELLKDFAEHLDPSLKVYCEDLIALILRKDTLGEEYKKQAEEILSNLHATVAIPDNITQVLTSDDSGSYQVELLNNSLSAGAFIKIPPVELARQIFAFHAEIYKSVFCQGFIYSLLSSWEGIDKKTDAFARNSTFCFFLPNQVVLNGFINNGNPLQEQKAIRPLFTLNSFSQHVIRQIVTSARSSSPSKRAQLITHWIKVGNSLLRDFGDVYGWSCVAEALLNTQIGRLADTWKLVDGSLINELTNEWLPLLIGEKSLSRSEVVIPQVSTVMGQVAEKFQSESAFKSEEEVLKRGFIPLERWEWANESFFELARRWSPVNVSTRLALIKKHDLIQSWISGIYENENEGVLTMSTSHVAVLKELYNLIDTNESDLSSVLHKYASSVSSSLFQDSLLCESPRHYSIQVGSNYNTSGNDLLHIPDVPSFFSAFRARLSGFSELSGNNEAASSPAGSPSVKLKFGKAKSREFHRSLTNLDDVVNSNNLGDENLELVISSESVVDQETVTYLKAGTQERLLDFLVLGERDINEFPKWNKGSDVECELFDDIFMKTFFATFRSFTSPSTVLEGLKRRWNTAEKHSSGTVNDVVYFRTKILRLIEYWITKYFVDFADDPNVLESLQKFIFFLVTKTESDEALNQSVLFLQSTVLKKSRVPLSVSSKDYSKAVQLSNEASSSTSVEKILELTLDDLQVPVVTTCLGYYASQLFKSVSMVEWVQVIDLLENGSPGFSVSFHSFTKLLYPTGATSVEDQSLDITDIFTILSLIYPPSNTVKTPNSKNGSASSTPSMASKDRNAASTNPPGSPKVISTLSVPLMTLLPTSIQRLYHFHQNLRAWSMHQILSATSARHRVQRIKSLLEIARQARRNYGRGNMISRPILSALVSPESRIFGRAWMTLHEMPVDGIELKTKRADKEKFDTAESYVELLEILYSEIVDVLMPSKLMRQMMNDRADVPLEMLPSLEDLLDFFSDVTIHSSDYFFAQKDGDTGVKLNPTGNNSSNLASVNTTATIKGISANMGLPLVNFEKRLSFYALCSKLSDIIVSSWEESYTPETDFSFLLIPEFVAGNQQFLCDYETAYKAALKDNNDGKPVIISKGKLKFFTKLVEKEKELRKRRDKEWKRLDNANDKKKVNDYSSKGTVIKGDKNIKSSGAGIGNSVGNIQQQSTSQMLSNMLRFRSRGSFGSVNSASQSTQYSQQASSAVNHSPVGGHNRSGSAASVPSIIFPSSSSQKAQSNTDISQGSAFKSVSSLNQTSVNNANLQQPSGQNSVTGSQTISSHSATEHAGTSSSSVMDHKKNETASKHTEKNPVTVDTKREVTFDTATPRENELSPFLAAAANDPRYSKPVKVVSLLQSRSHVATDYSKRNFVFRILTEDEQEILLQAISRDDMFDWIKKLNEASVRRIEEESRVPKKEEEPEPRPLDKDAAKDSMPGLFGAAMNNIMNRRKHTDNAGSAPNPQNLTQKSEDKPRTFGVGLLDLLHKDIRDKLIHDEKHEQSSINPIANFFKRGNNSNRNANVGAVANAGDNLQAMAQFIVWNEENSIPIVIQKCLSEVEERGIAEVGIYRLSGSSNAIRDLKKAFDTSTFLPFFLF